MRGSRFLLAIPHLASVVSLSGQEREIRRLGGSSMVLHTNGRDIPLRVLVGD